MNNKQRGFTLIETMVVTAITGILAATAYPSFAGPLFKARRTDGLTALLHLQMSQERWRSDHGSYASMVDLKMNPTTSMGYYQLSISDTSATGFSATATGAGTQANDSACKVLRIVVDGGNTSYVSGANEQAANSGTDNKRCWNL